MSGSSASSERLLEPHGFACVGRSTLVNLRRVQRFRPIDGGEGYELVMEPPVNRVIPISRRRVTAILGRYGQG